MKVGLLRSVHVDDSGEATATIGREFDDSPIGKMKSWHGGSLSLFIIFIIIWRKVKVGTWIVAAFYFFVSNQKSTAGIIEISEAL